MPGTYPRHSHAKSGRVKASRQEHHRKPPKQFGSRLSKASLLQYRRNYEQPTHHPLAAASTSTAWPLADVFLHLKLYNESACVRPLWRLWRCGWKVRWRLFRAASILQQSSASTYGSRSPLIPGQTPECLDADSWYACTRRDLAAPPHYLSML